MLKRSSADIFFPHRPKSRCRNTDFFGDNAGERNISPNAFTYSPEMVPTSVLKHHRTIDDATSVSSQATGLSHTWATQQFTERQLTTAGRSVAKSRSSKSRSSHLNGSSMNRTSKIERPIDKDDMSEVSEITMATELGQFRGGPRFMISEYAMKQYRKDINNKAKSKHKNSSSMTKNQSFGEIFPDIFSVTSGSKLESRPIRFTTSTDDNFAAKFEKPKSPIIRKKPSPVNTTAERVIMSPIKQGT